ncbi:L-arabinose ABC transporter ATP-binding protein AraG [Lichenihabitans sp. PAMC28606]|uniref:L-arabinose ABC transporter ATP-binding protein AraG n=1 Tax=Lichenihabitans sp. PAMC28606 TaxID=2880932 RepID=UPI001D0B9820|nr:L-arabinose ABC transporter ATP-binding protein AraG [Lichenihabitans sp. PAMC28606]UDL94569.1 L-arabinose ABC transporter ATP-binding protein AraG [Lichenihabitans sp. PAMC28606]
MNAEVPVLRVDNIAKGFPGVQALKGVSFAVPAGTVHGLLGENGAGKSTFIKILGGDYRADEGTITMGGTPFSPATVKDAMAAGIAVVHQELQLVPELTVGENLTLGRFPNRGGLVSFRALHERAEAALATVGGGIASRTKVVHLSIGQRQMVEIAKAVMDDAKVIALDEPTSSLSANESEVLFRLIESLRARGKIILYVSHRLDEVFRLCDGATVLRDGRVAAHFASMAGITRDEIVQRMVGREIQDIWGWRARRLGDEVLTVRGIAGARLPVPASFSIAAGEILGFFGLVGAGRTELFRLVYGADARQGGDVTLAGRTVTATPKGSIGVGLVMCPEDRKADGIVQGRSVEENIVISTRRHFSPFGLIDRAQEARVADGFIEKLRVRTPSRKQDIVNLSGGNQQKTILARWLAEPDVKVLLVDEPTRGIDVGAKAEIYAILYDLAEKGLAVGVVSSDLPEVMGICDRILVMREGQVVAEFKRGAFDEHTILAAALPGDHDS